MAVLIVAVLAERVPMVAVPVEAVRLVPKVAGPEAKRVPMVAVPVEAVRFVPKVAGPEAKRVPIVAVPVEAVRLVPKVAAPVKVLVPATLNVPVDLTPELDSSSAEVVPLPSSMACNVPSIPPALTVLRSWP